MFNIFVFSTYKPTEKMKNSLLIFVFLLVNILVNAQNSDTTVFMIVQKMPQFEGGIEGIYQFLGKNLQFPEELLKTQKDYEGTISFTVEKDGSLTNFNFLVSKDCNSCEKEVLRLLKMMPKWTAGSQDGRFLRVKYMIRVGISWQKQCIFGYQEHKIAGWTGDSKQKVFYPSGKSLIILPKTAEVIQQPKVEEIFTTAEENPEFLGGMKAMNQYIYENLKYPNAAKSANIKGKVFLKFVLEKDGNIGEVKVLKGIGFGCDEEAILLVKNMPKWNVGQQNGKAVRVFYTMPIEFKFPK